MPASPAGLPFRQRAAAYVLRRLPGRDVEVLVMLHRDAPEAGVQIPGGGAAPSETPGEAALREACEETGARGLRFGEVVGSHLLRGGAAAEEFTVTTYAWMSTVEQRDSWDHEVDGGDGDHGLRMRCEFRPADEAGIDWGLDGHLAKALARFADTRSGHRD
ncbi:NUDIX domain-containing protein [Glycomyces halotolerans]